MNRAIDKGDALQILELSIQLILIAFEINTSIFSRPWLAFQVRTTL